MTDLLAKAFAEASNLTEAEQNLLAAWILEELAADDRWAQAFAQTPDLLSEMADEALEEHRRGETQVLVPDEL